MTRWIGLFLAGSLIVLLVAGTAAGAGGPVRYGLGGKLSLPPPPVIGQPAGSPGLIVPDTLWRVLGMPVFGTDVNVSGTGGGNETSIAADPTRPLYFVGGANTANRYNTTDGGVTWTRSSAPSSIGDPAVAYDGAGNAYYAHLTSYNCPDPVYVEKSANGGVTWGGSVQAITDPSPSDHFVDKEWITADTWPASPYYGRIYVAATSFYAPGCNLGAYIDNREILAYSSDAGATWSATITVSDPAHNQDQFVNPVVASNGTVYVSFQYQNCTYNCNGVPASNMLTRSTNGGLTWSAPITVTGQPISYTGASVSGYQNLLAYSPTTGFRHNDQMITGVNPTNPNEVYALWTDGRWESTFVFQSVTGWHADIAFSRSTDGGATWTPAMRVNDDAQGNGKDQFFPWMVVGSDGVIHATWYDRRNDPNGYQYREYYAQSTDGGLTWSANVPVGDVGGTPGGFIGDYSGLAVNSDNTLVLPLWTDQRSGQKVYTDRGVIGGAGTPTPTPTTMPPTPTNTPQPTVTATATATPTVTPTTIPSYQLYLPVGLYNATAP
jgi:hypothetical protein